MVTRLVLYGIALAVLLQLLVLPIIRAIFSPLRQVPGPLLARFTRLWYFCSVWKGQAQHEQIALHRKYAPSGQFYAPVVRLGPNLYSITSPEKIVYGIASKMTKTSWYQGFKHPSPDRTTFFTEPNIKKHAETRRKFQSMYSLSSLLHYEKYVESTQKVFKLRLDDMVKDGRKVDMHHWLQCYAFDVIGNITYSQSFGFLDEGKDVEGIIAALEANLSYATLVGIFAWLHPILFKITERMPGSGAAGRVSLQNFVRKHTAEREVQRAADEKAGKRSIPQDGVPRDFLDLALDAEQDAEKKMSKYDVFAMGMSNVVAGSDTTAVSLSGVLYYLTTNPSTKAKLRAELDQAIREGRMTAENITFKESQNLPYLQACIKEGLRLFAAVALPMWREVPEGGADILGHYFPGGSEVGINPWVAHYDQDIWGSDAEEFRPERWIESDAEKVKEMEHFYMPFGLGSRTCIGRHISYLEMCKVVPMIVSKYDLRLESAKGGLKTMNYWFVKPTDFEVVVEARR